MNKFVAQLVFLFFDDESFAGVKRNAWVEIWLDTAWEIHQGVPKAQEAKRACLLNIKTFGAETEYVHFKCSISFKFIQSKVRFNNFMKE